MKLFCSLGLFCAVLPVVAIACAERESPPPSTASNNAPIAPKYMPPIMPAYASSSETPSTAPSGPPPLKSGGGSSAPSVASSGATESASAPTSDAVTVAPSGAFTEGEKVALFVKAQARECFRKALKIDPNIDGTLTMKLTIGDKGAVTAVQASPSGKLPETLVTCVEKKSMPAQFAQPSSSPVTVTVPVLLSLKPKK